MEIPYGWARRLDRRDVLRAWSSSVRPTAASTLYRRTDGRIVWRYETGDQVTGSATVYEGAVYIGGVDGALYCLDAHTGALRWRYQTDGAITGAPQAHDGVVYFGSSDHYVYAIPA